MKLAFLNHNSIGLPTADRPLVSGSIGIWHYEIATRLAERCDVVVYSPSRNLIRFGAQRHGGATFSDVPNRGHGLATRLLGALRKASNPEVPLFAAGAFHAGFATLAALDIRRRGCDVVWIANFSQFAPIVRALNPRAKIGLHMHCDWLIQLDPDVVERRLRACDLIGGCSQYIVRGVQERFPAHAHKCHAVHNGVRLDAFPYEADAAHEATDSPTLLFVGRISPEKGVHVLLEAFRRVLAEIPGARLELLAGDNAVPYEYVVAISEDPLVEALARFYAHPEVPYSKHVRDAASAEVLERVDFLGFLPQVEHPRVYARADVAVFPSVWNEPFGMVIVEAMASGVPVVATRGGGIPEFVDDGSSGLLVQRGDAGELADAILRLLKDPDLRRSMSRAGRQVAERLTWDRAADNLYSILQGPTATPAR